MPTHTRQPVKVEQLERPANESPNKGYSATGRTREYLTPTEVEKLLATAKKKNSVYRDRDHLIILIMYRHGLRVSEAADLRWSDVDFEAGTLLVRRLKGSKTTTHYLEGDELRCLRRHSRTASSSPFVFLGADGSPLASTAISSVIKRLGKGLYPFPIHAHMLRHSCGYYLANKGIDTRTIQDYLGHRNIQNTERYIALSATKFRGLFS